jgi:hypothetical protein
MKNRFLLLIALGMAARLVVAEDDWRAGELKDAFRQLEQRQYNLSHDIYRNALLVHQAVPLNATALEQARSGIAATAARLKIDEARTPGAAFMERVKRLGFVQVGTAWMPPQAKERLSSDAAAKLVRLAHGRACLVCKGQGINTCPNCVSGVVRCMGCSGTGRMGGSPITSRGAMCLACDGRGKIKCVLCRGTGCGVCPKCDGIGVVE